MSGSFSSWVFAALVLILAVVGSVLYLAPGHSGVVSEAEAAWHGGALERVHEHRVGSPVRAAASHSI